MPGSWIPAAALAVDAPLRLFCFPHAGGGAGFFGPWREELAPDVAVCPVVLPGREARLRERPYTRIGQLIDPLFGAIEQHADRPFAIFGHSMGAIVGYEIARRFSAAGRPPLRLFVSGRRAPQLPPRRAPLTDLPDDQFIAAIGRFDGTPAEVLREHELLRVFLPGLRADFALNDCYAPLPGGLLSCPVSASAGAQDPETTKQEIAAWQEVTTGEFRLRLYDGGHFYLKHASHRFISALRADLGLISVTA